MMPKAVHDLTIRQYLKHFRKYDYNHNTISLFRCNLQSEYRSLNTMYQNTPETVTHLLVQHIVLKHVMSLHAPWPLLSINAIKIKVQA